MFPMPRIMYSMACDGILFKPLAKLLPKVKTPWVAGLVTGFVASNHSQIIITKAKFKKLLIEKIKLSSHQC